MICSCKYHDAISQWMNKQCRYKPNPHRNLCSNWPNLKDLNIFTSHFLFVCTIRRCVESGDEWDKAKHVLREMYKSRNFTHVKNEQFSNELKSQVTVAVLPRPASRCHREYRSPHGPIKQVPLQPRAASWCHREQRPPPGSFHIIIPYSRGELLVTIPLLKITNSKQ